MKHFQAVVSYATLVLSIVCIIILSIVVPKEGKTVEYRLDHGSNSQNGVYPIIIQVVENGRDHLIHLPGNTMQEAFNTVQKLNQDLNQNK